MLMQLLYKKKSLTGVNGNETKSVKVLWERFEYDGENDYLEYHCREIGYRHMESIIKPLWV